MEGHDESPNVDWAKEVSQIRRQFGAIIEFAHARQKVGQLSLDEEAEISRAANKIVVYAGGLRMLEDNAISAALGKQGVHAMIKKLRELRPEWEEDIANLVPPARGR